MKCYISSRSVVHESDEQPCVIQTHMIVANQSAHRSAPQPAPDDAGLSFSTPSVTRGTSFFGYVSSVGVVIGKADGLRPEAVLRPSSSSSSSEKVSCFAFASPPSRVAVGCGARVVFFEHKHRQDDDTEGEWLEDGSVLELPSEVIALAWASPDLLLVSCVSPAPSYMWVRVNSADVPPSDATQPVKSAFIWKRAAIIGSLVQSMDEITSSRQRPHANVSGDGVFLATAGPRDRLAKVWRLPTVSRAILDANATEDPSHLPSVPFVYLPHPRSLISVSWRDSSRSPASQQSSNVLMTVARDGVVRLWVESAGTQVAHLCPQFILSNIIETNNVTSSASALLKQPTSPKRQSIVPEPSSSSLLAPVQVSWLHYFVPSSSQQRTTSSVALSSPRPSPAPPSPSPVSPPSPSAAKRSASSSVASVADESAAGLVAPSDSFISRISAQQVPSGKNVRVDWIVIVHANGSVVIWRVRDGPLQSTVSGVSTGSVWGGGIASSLSLSLFRMTQAELVPKEERIATQLMWAASLEEREEEPARLHLFTLGNQSNLTHRLLDLPRLEKEVSTAVGSSNSLSGAAPSQLSMHVVQSSGALLSDRSILVASAYGHRADITALHGNQSAPFFASLDRSGLLALWEISEGPALTVVPAFHHIHSLSDVVGFAWLSGADGSRFVVATSNSLTLYRLNRISANEDFELQLLSVLPLPPNPFQISSLHSLVLDSAVSSVSSSLPPLILAVSMSGSSVSCYRPQEDSYSLVNTIRLGDEPLSALCTIPPAVHRLYATSRSSNCFSFVTAASNSGKISVWKLRDDCSAADVLAEFELRSPRGHIDSIHISADGRIVVLSSEIRTARIVNRLQSAGWFLEGTITVENKPPQSLCADFIDAAGDGSHLLAFGGDSKSLTLYALRNTTANQLQSFDSSWQPVITYPLSSQPSCVAFSTGALIASSGTQLNVYPSSTQLRSTATGLETDLRGAARNLQRSLPLYHPKVIAELLMAGRLPLAAVCVKQLTAEVLSKSPPDSSERVTLSRVPMTLKGFGAMLMTPSSNAAVVPADTNSGLASVAKRSDADLDATKKREADEAELRRGAEYLIEALTTRVTLGELSRDEQRQLVAVVGLLDEVLQQQRVLDASAQKILLSLVLQSASESNTGPGAKRVRKKPQAESGPSMSGSTAVVQPTFTSLSSSEWIWALHSDAQDVLLTKFMNHVGASTETQILWPALKAAGIGLWMKNPTVIRGLIEKVAKNHFLQRKNPSDAALFYLALSKKTALVALYKASQDEKMMQFFAQDFTQQRWQTAALKNAYALMSQHQILLAAGFFMLAGKIPDAVSLLLRPPPTASSSSTPLEGKYGGEWQLALIVARLMEGEDSPSYKKTLNEFVLPMARETGDIWLESAAYWLLKDYQSALRVLASSSSLASSSTSVSPSSSSSSLVSSQSELVKASESSSIACLSPLRNAVPAKLHFFRFLSNHMLLRSNLPPDFADLETRMKEEVAYSYRHTRSDLLALLNKYSLAKSSASSSDSPSPLNPSPLLVQSAVQYLAKEIEDIGRDTWEKEKSLEAQYGERPDGSFGQTYGATDLYFVSTLVEAPSDQLSEWIETVSGVRVPFAETNSLLVQILRSLRSLVAVPSLLASSTVMSSADSFVVLSFAKKVSWLLRMHEKSSSLNRVMKPRDRIAALASLHLALLFCSLLAPAAPSTHSSAISVLDQLADVSFPAKAFYPLMDIASPELNYSYAPEGSGGDANSSEDGTSHEISIAVPPPMSTEAQDILLQLLQLVVIARSHLLLRLHLNRHTKNENGSTASALIASDSSQQQSASAGLRQSGSKIASSNPSSPISRLSKGVPIQSFVELLDLIDRQLNEEVLVRKVRVNALLIASNLFAPTPSPAGKPPTPLELFKRTKFYSEAVDKLWNECAETLRQLPQLQSLVPLLYPAVAANPTSALRSSAPSTPVKAASVLRSTADSPSLAQMMAKDSATDLSYEAHMAAPVMATDQKWTWDEPVLIHKENDLVFSFCISRKSKYDEENGGDVLALASPHHVKHFSLLPPTAAPPLSSEQSSPLPPSASSPRPSPSSRENVAGATSADDSLEFWKDGGKRVKWFAGRRDEPAYWLTAHPSGGTYIAGGANGSIVVYSYHSSSYQLGLYKSSGGPLVNRVHFNAIGSKFGACDDAGNVSLYRFEDQAMRGSASMAPFFSLQCHTKRALDFTFLNPAGSLIASCGISRDDYLPSSVCVWDSLLPPHKALVHAWAGPPAAGNSLAYSPSRGLLYCGGKEGELSVFDLRQRRLQLCVRAHTRNVKSMSIDPTEALLATGSTDGSIRIWDLSGSTPVLTQIFAQAHSQQTFFRTPGGGASAFHNTVSTFGVMHLQFAPSNYLISSGADGRVIMRQYRAVVKNGT